MRYHILGSKGFIGAGIINYLKKKKKIQIFKYKKISELKSNHLKSKDIIINCLGKNFLKENTYELKKKIQIIKNIKKKILWIQLSTPLVYKQKINSKKISEKTKEVPFNEYALSKLKFDNYLKKQKNSNFSYLILRISTVYDIKMKSLVIKKLKLINESLFYSLIVNHSIIFNYISLDELVVYIYKLSINKKSRNQLILISQNINLTKLIGRSNKKNYFLNRFLFSIKKILTIFFSEQVLFLTNKNLIQNNYLQQFIKIESKDYSNKKIINFFKKC
jgi:dTDP-4-dehydrorhamnose reductase